jgi:hypothetical protein
MSVDYRGYVFYGAIFEAPEDSYPWDDIYDDRFTEFRKHIDILGPGGYQNHTEFFLIANETQVKVEADGYGIERPFKRLKELTPEDKFAYQLVFEQFAKAYGIELGEPGWYSYMMVS